MKKSKKEGIIIKIKEKEAVNELELVQKHFGGKHLLTNDLIFQQVFGNNPDILMDFLNSVFENCKIDKLEKIEKPQDLVICNELSLPKIVKEQKGCRLDIKAECKKQIFNIEMQIAEKDDILNRIIRYGDILNSFSLKRGEDYDKSKNIISILLTDFDIYKDDLPYYMAENYHKIVYKDKDGKIVAILEDLDIKRKIIILNLKKFKKIASKEKQTMLEKWLTLISFSNEKEIEKIMKNNETMAKAVIEMDKFLEDPYKVMALEEIEMERAIQKNKIVEARDQGIKDGIEKGIKKGIEKGIEKGIILSIQKMRKANISSDEIIKILDLDKKLLEIDEIKSVLYN